MLCYNAGFLPHRQAYGVGIGLSEANLVKMLDQNKPARLASETLALPEPGCDFVLFAATDRAQIEGRACGFLEPLLDDKNAKIPCLHLDKRFYVMFFSRGNRPIYLIGLDGVSYGILRNRGLLTFRSRPVEGKMVPVEVVVFWGPSEDMLEEQFYAAGLVAPGHKILRVAPGQAHMEAERGQDLQRSGPEPGPA